MKIGSERSVLLKCQKPCLHSCCVMSIDNVIRSWSEFGQGSIETLEIKGDKERLTKNLSICVRMMELSRAFRPVW